MMFKYNILITWFATCNITSHFIFHLYISSKLTITNNSQEMRILVVTYICTIKLKDMENKSSLSMLYICLTTPLQLMLSIIISILIFTISLLCIFNLFMYRLPVIDHRTFPSKSTLHVFSPDTTITLLHKYINAM